MPVVERLSEGSLVSNSGRDRILTTGWKDDDNLWWVGRNIKARNRATEATDKQLFPRHCSSKESHFASGWCPEFSTTTRMFLALAGALESGCVGLSGHFCLST
jgi:hypothetical protein